MAALSSSGSIVTDTPDQIYSSTDSDGETIYRCPKGYVFDGSWIFGDSTEDRSFIVHNGTGYVSDSGAVVEYDPVCIPKNCEPGSFIDSDKEYDVLLGDSEEPPQTVRCNEGYVFDHHRKHRSGEVYCTYKPKLISEPIKTNYEMDWYVYDERLDNVCAANNETDKETCESTIDPNPPENSLDTENPTIAGCVWEDTISNDIDGFSVEGQCLFRKHANHNQDYPICQPMLCPRKEIEHSNRQIDRDDGPLPGPRDGNIHGSCLNENGETLDHITHSSDCNCYKHKTCATCTVSEDCQWCPSPEEDGSGFCYSTHTYHQICEDNSYRHSRGGTCKHAKTNQNRELPDGVTEWTQETCEEMNCVTQQFWNNNIQEEATFVINGVTYERDSLSQTECLNFNNTWDLHGHHNYDDTCIVTNNEYLNDIDKLYNYYPIISNTGIKLNTSEYICIPQDTFTSATMNDCDQHVDYVSCETDESCQFVENPLRNSLFQWDSTTSRKVNFQPGTSCPINPINGGYSVSYADNYITLASATLNGSFSNDYNLDCNIQIEGEDIFNVSACESELGGNHTGDPVRCRTSISYCDSTMTSTATTCLNDHIVNGVCMACAPGETIEVGGTTVAGCIYDNNASSTSHCNSADLDGEPRCMDPLDISPYTCRNSIIGEPSQNNEAACLSIPDNTFSGYSTSSLFDIQPSSDFIISNFKPNAQCDISTLPETNCDRIGRSNAHYSKYCQLGGLGGETFNIPMKQVCLSLGNTWVHQNAEGWVCVDDTPRVLTDTCQLLNTEDKYIKPVGDGYQDYTHTNNPWTPTNNDTCILEADTMNPVTAEEQLEDLCTSYENHSIGFVYAQSSDFEDFTPVCIANDPIRQEATDMINTLQSCEGDNKYYVQEYNYVDTGSCLGITAPPLNVPDEITTWTGGEITTEDGVHVSECSPTILSSCNVECDSGYGGGGEYICHYTSDNGEQCGSIIDQDECLSHPSCMYDSANGCSADPTADNEGRLEWLGSECYKIDNTAFSHGIASIPPLNELFPPVWRVIITFILGALFIVLITLIVIKPLIVALGRKLGGKATETGKSIRNTIENGGFIDVVINTVNSVANEIKSLGVKGLYSNAKESIRGNNSKGIYLILSLFIVGYIVLLSLGTIDEFIKSSVTSITDGISLLGDKLGSFITSYTRVSNSEIQSTVEGDWDNLEVNYRSLTDVEIANLQQSITASFLNRDNLEFPSNFTDDDQTRINNYIEQQQSVGTLGSNFVYEISEDEIRLFTDFVNSIAQVWNQ